MDRRAGGCTSVRDCCYHLVDMRLYQLAIACQVYASFEGELDESLALFRELTQRPFDFDSDRLGSALMRWLNEWGCRQFKKEDHGVAVGNLRLWASDNVGLLPPASTSILELAEPDFRRAANAYDALTRIQACERQRSGRSVPVGFGPTGAAKVLFVLRPDSLPPWDEAIRDHFHLDGSAESYAEFLRLAASDLSGVVMDAAHYGIDLAALPSEICRSGSTLPKLIDEYYWVKFTRRFQVPEEPQVRRWAEWSAGNR